MAFNLRFLRGATIEQIRSALEYQQRLITPEQEEQLKKEKAIPVDEVPKLCNEVINPSTPAGAVGVPYQQPSPRRITGTHDN